MNLRTDIYEHEGHLVVAIEVPGVDESMLDIQIERFVLTIEATRPAPQSRGSDYHRRERPAGPFRRAISLPRCISDRARRLADTQLLDGVFTMRIPLDAIEAGA